MFIDPVDTLAGCSIRNTHDPQGIAQLATLTGGRLFENGQDAATAVSTRRDFQSCSFRLSARTLPDDARKTGGRVRIRSLRRGFTITAPERLESPEQAADLAEKRQALFLHPSWGKGLFASAGLWPQAPVGRSKKKWNALIMARLKSLDDGFWSEDIDEIVLQVVAYKGGLVFGESNHVLDKDEVADLRSRPAGRLFLFPIQVKAGDVTISVVAQAGAEAGASNRARFLVPRRPQHGEIRPWLVVDAIARIEGELSLLPSLASKFKPSEPPLLLGYGCTFTENSDNFSQGVLVREHDDLRREVAIRWIQGGRPPSWEAGVCDWTYAAVDRALEPGLWSFYYNTDPASPGRVPDARFRIATGEAMAKGQPDEATAP